MSATTDAVEAATAVVNTVIAFLGYRETRAQRLHMVRQSSRPAGSAYGQETIGWQQPTQLQPPPSPYPTSPQYTDPWRAYPPPSYPASLQPTGPSGQRPSQPRVPQQSVPGVRFTVLYGFLFGMALALIRDSPAGMVGEIIVAICYVTLAGAIFLIVRRTAPDWSARMSWLLATGAGASAAALFYEILAELVQ